MIDELAQRHRQRQHGNRCHQQGAQGRDHHAPVGPEERQQRPQGIERLGAGDGRRWYS